MKKILLSLFVLSLIASTGTLKSQNKSANWCRTDEQTQLLEQMNPAIIQQRQELEDYIANFKETHDPTAKKATIIIPIVFHVITDNGNGNVTKAEVVNAVNVLNRDFQRMNADTSNTRSIFKPYAASLDLEFRLARKDPNGNCTEGIVRVESPLSANATDAIKSVSYWDSKKYFNVWVVDLINGSNPPSYIAGYAQFPSSGINSTYGVIIDNTFLSGRTLTHEIGHCFNLFHTFQSGCGFNCGSSGDMCCDTPPVSTSSGSCDYNENTCSNDNNGGSPYGGNVVDQIENYMSYNSCQNMFSLNQATRMMAVLNSTNTTTGLAQLWTPTNLAFTGTADPYDANPICIPWGANFTYDKTWVCAGDQVTYNDIDTYNATPTLWDWTFTGGNPSTSSQQTPVITYNNVGVYGATYRPGTTAGYATMVSKSNIITVSAVAAQFTLPFTDSFENTTTFNNDWTVETSSGNGWQNTTTAAYTGSRSVRVNNLSNSIGDITDLISPSYDLTSMNTPRLEWKCAYAKKTTGGNDQLFIQASTDCGATWTTIALKSASTMSSGIPATDASFVPSGPSQWKSNSLTLNATLAASSNVRFKFYFKSNGGNNIYLDDINVDGTVGIEETKLVNNLSVYPNPTTESAFVSFNLIGNVKNLNITLRDVLGKEVTKIINAQAFAAGKYTLSIDQQKKLQSGLYFIEFNADNKVSVEKLVVK